jgi:hypothetical protein
MCIYYHGDNPQNESSYTIYPSSHRASHHHYFKISFKTKRSYCYCQKSLNLPTNNNYTETFRTFTHKTAPRESNAAARSISSSSSLYKLAEIGADKDPIMEKSFKFKTGSDELIAPYREILKNCYKKSKQ